jgi:hypothetical protein
MLNTNLFFKVLEEEGDSRLKLVVHDFNMSMKNLMVLHIGLVLHAITKLCLIKFP